MNEQAQDPYRRYRRLVQRVVDGDIPRGKDFDACRAVVRAGGPEDAVYTAICALLEGALAEASLAIDDAQDLVPLLKGLARGSIPLRAVL